MRARHDDARRKAGWRRMSGSWVRPGDVPRDPGLQPERTILAWSRTWLAALVTLLLVVRAVLLRGDAGNAGGAGDAGATAVVAWVALGVAVGGGLLLACAAFLPGPDLGTAAAAAGAAGAFMLIAAATTAVLAGLAIR